MLWLVFHFRFELEVKSVEDADRVFVWTKKSIDAKTSWSDQVQMYPSLLDLQPHEPHSPTTVPSLAPNNDWEIFEEKIQTSLTK